MDNVPYHNVLEEKTPTTAWNNINFPDSYLKIELLNVSIVRQHKPQTQKYKIEAKYSEQKYCEIDNILDDVELVESENYETVSTEPNDE